MLRASYVLRFTIWRTIVQRLTPSPSFWINSFHSDLRTETINEPWICEYRGSILVEQPGREAENSSLSIKRNNTLTYLHVMKIKYRNSVIFYHWPFKSINWSCVWYLFDMEVCYWALLFMPLVILHHLLNVFLQFGNKRGFKQKKIFYHWPFKNINCSCVWLHSNHVVKIYGGAEG
jgi:hypothetical protein